MNSCRTLLCMAALLFCTLPPSSALAGERDEAQRRFDRGMAALEMATARSGYQDAAAEFAEATRLAPDWPEAHYNLGLVREKLDDLEGAMASLKRYLELAPQATDAAAVRSQLNKLEYRRDKRNDMKTFFDTLARPSHYKRSIGGDTSCGSWTEEMVYSGNKIVILNKHKYTGEYIELNNVKKEKFDVNINDKKYQYKAVHYTCTSETSKLFKAQTYCPIEYDVSGEIISFSPIILKEDIVVTSWHGQANNVCKDVMWEVLPFGRQN